MKDFKLLMNFMEGNRLAFLCALAAICLSSVFSTIIPLVIKISVDSVIGDKPLELPAWVAGILENLGGRSVLAKNLWICGVVIVVFTAVYGVFAFFKGRLTAAVSENSGKRVRENLYDHIVHLPYDYHVKSHTGDLIQRCTSDIETVQNFISSQFVEMGQSIFSFCLVLGVMLSMDAFYAFISIVLVPVILVFTTRFFVNMKKTYRMTDESEGRMTSTLQENLMGVRVVKAFGAQNLETCKFDEKNSEYRDYVYKILLLMSKFWSTSDFLCLTQFSIVLLAGVYWVNTGSITLGTLIAFTSYAGMLIWPVRQLGQMMAFMGQAFVSLTRIQEILDYPAEAACETEKKPEIRGDIEFKNVYFGYDEANPVLKDLSMKISRGQTVAILGATGSGKSSLVHLLVRLYDYQKGSIKVDGVELREIERKWMRKHVGMVLQEPFLFSKTIKDNLRYGKIDALDNEIHASSKTAAIHGTILAFEKGYETVIGERGMTLSGGQRQRLAIARAVIADVPVLVFDDSLSAVDMETDAAIRRTLKKRSRHITTIIISHRITTLSEADVIFVLEDGRIRQSGTHEELIREDGPYRKVWELQGSLECR